MTMQTLAILLVMTFVFGLLLGGIRRTCDDCADVVRAGNRRRRRYCPAVCDVLDEGPPMTVEELIEQLQHMPPEAMLVFEFDDADSYDFVSVNYSHGEVIIHVEDEPEEPND